MRRAPATPDGRFRFDNVVASDYMLTVSDVVDSRSWNTAVRDLSLPGDVTDLVLFAGPSVSLEGRVTHDSGGPLPFDPSELRITTEQRTSSTGLHGAGSTRVTTDGTFSMRSGAGLMSVRIVGLPPGWFMKSVQLNGTDVTDAEFNLAPGGRQHFDITLTDRVSRLGGTVTDRSARPVSNALVVVFPEDRARWTNTALSGRRSRTSRVVTRWTRCRYPNIASSPSHRCRATRGWIPRSLLACCRIPRPCRSTNSDRARCT